MTDYFNPDVKQQFDDTCAIKSQQLILEDFGIDVSETELVSISCAKGWYDGEGTSPKDVGNLLQLAGIPVSRQSGNVFNLMNELAQGHKVIVGLDANELWYNETLDEKMINLYNDVFGPQGGNHALVVMGIDTSDPNNVQVIVKDPGTGEDGKPYPLNEFMDAWADTQFYMVSTDSPAPGFAPGMENFDQFMGHLPSIANVSYPDFLLFNDISMGLPEAVMLLDGTYSYPMSSLVDAYLDFASNQIDFAHIFSPNYMFNEYLDCSLVNNHMIPTCHTGFDKIEWTQIQPRGFDNEFDRLMLANSGMDLYAFYNNCISQFEAIGDYDSMQLCQQQIDIMNYCHSNNIDYSMDFLN